MARNPKDASESPINVDETDVVSDVLRAVRLTAEVFGRFELSAPWAMRVPGDDYLAFYVIARGGAWLELEAEGRRRPTHQVTLSAGDVVLLPHGGTHVLRDPSRSARAERTRVVGRQPPARALRARGSFQRRRAAPHARATGRTVDGREPGARG